MADAVFPDPDAPQRAVSAVLALLALSIAVAIRVHGPRVFPTRFDPQWRHAVLYPSGPAPASYHLSRSPGIELRQALIGPGVSIVAGLVLLLPLIAIPASSTTGRITIGFAAVNLALGAIALLPALPFSGGLIVRAAFWYFHDSHRAGSRVAFLYSQVVAVPALGYGAFLLSWRSSLLIPGLWCLVLGWLVVRGSRSELMRSHLIERAARIRASDAVFGLNPTVRASDPLATAVDILLEQRDNGPGLVRDRNRFVGVLTLDTVREISRADWKSTSVRDVMRPFTEFVDSEPDARLLEVLRIRSDLDDRPVVVRHPGGQIAGLISGEIAPRVLLQRGEDRSIDLQHSEPTRKRSTGP